MVASTFRRAEDVQEQSRRPGHLAAHSVSAIRAANRMLSPFSAPQRFDTSNRPARRGPGVRLQEYR